MLFSGKYWSFQKIHSYCYVRVSGQGMALLKLPQSNDIPIRLEQVAQPLGEAAGHG
jgi:hypothetical protein